MPKSNKSNKQTKTVSLPQFIIKEMRFSSSADISKPPGPPQWPRLEALVADPGGDWYHELVRNDAYDKLCDLRGRHLKGIVICPRSKRWWDGELSAQAKVVRRARRGGV